MSFGLALSGGGFRGIAHLGVAAAFQAFGIKPSMYAGVSAGSIAGAFLAAGYDPEETLAIVNRHSLWKYIRPGLRHGGLISIRRMARILEKYLKDYTFDSLELPLKVTAVDLIQNKTEIFEKGPLIPALLASSSVPLIFEPFSLGERKFIDGGILENIPYRYIQNSMECIAVDVMVNPGKGNYTSLADTIERTMEVITLNQPVPGHIRIIKPLEKHYFPLFGSGHGRAIYEAAYRHTLGWLEVHGPQIRN